MHRPGQARAALPPALCALASLGALGAQPPGFRAETVATGLHLASAMAFAPDGRLFVVERESGKVLVLESGKPAATWATIAVTVTSGDSRGLLGIAVDPDFLRNGYVYVSVSGGGTTGENAVVRLREKSGAGTGATVIGPRMPSTRIHNIGPLVFGGDGKLYVSTGDGFDSRTAQDLSERRGKVLRMNAPDGAVPADNPFPGSHVWAYGLRNAWGLAVHPHTGRVYLAENGDELADELDLLLRGANYGWPVHEGAEKTPDAKTEDPLWTWSPSIGPTGSCFCRGPLYPVQYQDGWIVCDWNHGRVLHAQLDAAGTAVTGVGTLFDYDKPVFGAAGGPDGALYVLCTTDSLRGGDRIDRLLHAAAPSPALAVTATSHVALGGSVTIGITAKTGDRVLAWVGAARLAAPVATPFGDFFVPTDILLPPFAVPAGDRLYLGFSVPNDANLKGKVVHVQGGVVSGALPRMTNPHSLTLL